VCGVPGVICVPYWRVILTRGKGAATVPAVAPYGGGAGAGWAWRFSQEARMSVNVDGETEKAVDSIIERLLAVRLSPPDPCRPDVSPTSFALKQARCCGHEHRNGVPHMNAVLFRWLMLLGGGLQVRGNKPGKVCNQSPSTAVSIGPCHL
jgi:hypothetical protein